MKKMTFKQEDYMLMETREEYETLFEMCGNIKNKQYQLC